MAKAMFSETAQKILRFLQQNPNVDLTAKEIAEAIGVPPRSVNGCVSRLTVSGYAKRDLKYAGDAQCSLKVVHLTDMGRQVDPSAEK